MVLMRKRRRCYIATIAIALFALLIFSSVELRQYNRRCSCYDGTLKSTGGFLELPTQSDGTRNLKHIGHAIVVTRHSATLQAADIDKANKTWCLTTDPGFQKDEIGVGFIEDGQYCMDSRKTWKLNINFNIERFYKFDPVLQQGNNDVRSNPMISDKSQHNVADGIPKKFHFIWSDAVIPSVFVDNLKQFRKIHPKWEINFWTLKHGRKLVGALEPHILEAYNGYKTDTARADALRYVLLYHYGGAYLDVDIHPLIPFDNLTTMADCIMGPEPMEHAFLSRNGRSFLSNAILFCKPKHPLFRYVIDHLPMNSSAGNILGTTGPFYFTKCFNDFTNKHFGNRTYVQALGTFNMFVSRHEYFEFKLRGRALDKMKGVCDPVVQNVEYFMKQCVSEITRPNCTIARGGSHKDRLLFDVCYEWVLHGRSMRNVSGSIRYADHVHYASMLRLKSLKYTPENNITRILPDAISHL